MLNVLDYGACGDASRLDTEAVQRCIDLCHSQGGGVVLLPGGHTYKCGTLALRSNVELRLESGAVLKASDDIKDYTPFGAVTKDEDDQVPSYVNCEYNGEPAHLFLYARDAENVRITGFGVIDGTEEIYYGRGDRYLVEGSYYPRTPLFYAENVRHLTVQDVTLTRSAFWTLHLVGCEDVLVSGARILNSLKLANCDGIDPDHCRNVRIIGCHIETADDSIVLKSSGAHMAYGPTENIIIQGCTLTSTSAAIKFGTESEGDFRNVLISGCCISRSNRGVSLQLRDGGSIENVEISDLAIETRAFSQQYWGAGEAFCFTALPRHEGGKTGHIRNVRVRNVHCRGEGGVFLYAAEKGLISNISLTDVDLTLCKSSKWPLEGYDLRPADGEASLHSKRFGVYSHQAEGLRLERVEVTAEDSYLDVYGGERYDD